jgi:hypothetical protein
MKVRTELIGVVIAIAAFAYLGIKNIRDARDAVWYEGGTLSPKRVISKNAPMTIRVVSAAMGVGSLCVAAYLVWWLFSAMNS